MRKFKQLKVGQIVTNPKDGQDYEVIGIATSQHPIGLRKAGTTNEYSEVYWSNLRFWTWK